jgi:hypothetical protein
MPYGFIKVQLGHVVNIIITEISWARQFVQVLYICLPNLLPRQFVHITDDMLLKNVYNNE